MSLPNMGRERFARQSLGTLQAQIKKTRVLMIGAGGIGCELLKNLILTGFEEVHIVDIDTIDLSNLNRQFLFRHEHIKKAKALVAKDTASKFNPSVKLEAHHANIKDPHFTVAWFKGFHIVFNALDNLDARRHVNKMCLAADVPLIESGTTGFNGQVQVIKRGITECYDCNTKEVPKSFPVCTIRSTPSQPIHCIVWAKSYLFMEIFGMSEDDVGELDHSADLQNAEEIENLRLESQALKRMRRSMDSDEFPRLIFDKVFKEDINRLRSMDDMWKSRPPPTPLDFDQMLKDLKPQILQVQHRSQSPWSVMESFAVFKDSLQRLSARLLRLSDRAEAKSVTSALEFDKDDEDSLDFVAATANLRSYVFGIEAKSKFDIKQMAGNIIPAIATTNAMTAGLCVLQAFKVLRRDLGKARMVFLERSTARVINSDTLKPPNPDCSMCGVSQSTLIVDTHRATLNDLVEDVLKLQLGYGEELTISNEVGILFDPELDDNLAKKLSDLGIKAETFLTVVDDDDEDPRVNLLLSISEKTLPDDSKPIILPEKIEIARKSKSLEKVAATNGVTSGGSQIHEAISTKRKRSLEQPAIGSSRKVKKSKLRAEAFNDDEPLLVVDSGNGAIVIEDD